MIRAYIDIDGVLIRSGTGGPELIPRFRRIIRYLKKHFDCYWLTTHVRHDSGSAGASWKLAPFLKERRIDRQVLDGIKPTTWQTLKTEAIDFAQPFIWLEDNILSVERQILEERCRLNSLVEVDWKKRPMRLTVRRLRKARKDILRRPIS